MKTKIWLVLILVTIVITLGTGCGSKHWYKPDMTEEQYKIDAYACKRDVNFASAGTNRPMWGMYDQCMESKGYRMVK